MWGMTYEDKEDDADADDVPIRNLVVTEKIIGVSIPKEWVTHLDKLNA